MIGSESRKVTADPLNVTHIVSGSLPSCSVAVPEEVVVAATGNVTGIGMVQVLSSAVTVTSVMDRPSLGLH
jgi:hypothetical protein